MKKIKIALVSTVLALTSCQDNDSLNGKVFIGFEEDNYVDAPKAQFQTIFSFKNDSVLVQRNSIIITGHDTLHFKNDESHYTYKGLVKKENENLTFIAFAHNCDECPTIAEVKENGDIEDVLDQVEYKGFVNNGGIKLNGTSFKQK